MPVRPSLLRTERLTLDRPAPSDVDAVYRIHTDPVACEHNPGDLLATRSAAEDRLHQWDAHWRRHGFGYWSIRRLDEGPAADPIGFCGLKVMRLHDREALNLFYRLDPAVWGTGLASEAATAVLAWAKMHVPERTVIARIRPANIASVRVAQRIGLHRAAHLDTDGEDGLDWIFVWDSATEGGRLPVPD